MSFLYTLLDTTIPGSTLFPCYFQFFFNWTEYWIILKVGNYMAPWKHLKISFFLLSIHIGKKFQ